MKIYCGTPILQAVILAIGAMSYGYYAGTCRKIFDEGTYFLHIENTLLYNFLVLLPMLIYLPIVFVPCLWKFLKLRICTFVLSVLGALFWILILVDYHTVWRYVCPAIIGAVEIILFFTIALYFADLAPKGHIRVFSCILCLGFSSGTLLAEIIQYRLCRGDIAIIGGTICILESIFIWFVDEPNKFFNNYKQMLPMQRKSAYTAFGMILALCLVTNVVEREILIKRNLSELYVKYDYIIVGIMRFFGGFISSFINDIISTKVIWCISTGCIAILQLLCLFSSIFKWGKRTSIATLFCTHFFYGFGVLPVLFSYYLRLDSDHIGKSHIIFSWTGFFSIINLYNYFISTNAFISMGYCIFLLCAILSILYFCYGVFLVEEPFDNDCWSDSNSDSSHSHRRHSHSNTVNNNHDVETGNDRHDTENENNINDAENENNINDAENENNINDAENENNINEAENENSINDAENENNIDEGENSLAVCI